MGLYVIQPWSPKIAGIPSQVLLVWISFFLVFLFKGNNVKIVLNSIPFFITILISLILGCLINSYINYGRGSSRILQCVTGITIFLLATVCVQKRKSTQTVLLYIASFSCLSGIITFLQPLGLANWTWPRTLYAEATYKSPSGLEAFPVAYSYSILPITIICIMPLFFNLSNNSQKFFSQHNKLQILGIPPALGIIIAQSRSALLAIFISIIFLYFITKEAKNIKKKTFFLILTLMIIFLSLPEKQSPEPNSINQKMQGIENDGRLNTNWINFLPIIINKPLGIGEVEYDWTKQRLNYSSDPIINYAYRINAGYAPHNFILTTSLFYGLPAALSVLLIYLITLTKSISLSLSLNKLKLYTHSYLILLVSLSNFSILIHSLFHNANIVMGEMRCWFWIGLNLGMIYYFKKQVILISRSNEI